MLAWCLRSETNFRQQCKDGRHQPRIQDLQDLRAFGVAENIHKMQQLEWRWDADPYTCKCMVDDMCNLSNEGSYQITQVNSPQKPINSETTVWYVPECLNESHVCVHALILQRSSASLPSGELCRDVKTASSAAASHGVAKVENQNWTMWKRC